MGHLRDALLVIHRIHGLISHSRTVYPVTLISNVIGVDNFEFNYGKGNLCAGCHQPREMTLPNSPKPDPTKTADTDTIVIKSSRWYSHYGVQSQMLAGTGGFEFEGYTFAKSNHTSNSVIKTEGCVICHMAKDEKSSRWPFNESCG